MKVSAFGNYICSYKFKSMPAKSPASRRPAAGPYLPDDLMIAAAHKEKPPSQEPILLLLIVWADWK